MKFERGQDPKEAMDIGKEAPLRKLIKHCIKNPSFVTWTDDKMNILQRDLWSHGIELTRISKTMGQPHYKELRVSYKPDESTYTLFYKDCNGEEAHIEKSIVFSEKELKSS